MKVTWGRIIIFTLASYFFHKKATYLFQPLRRKVVYGLKGILSVYVIAFLFRCLYARNSSKKEVFEALDLAVNHVATYSFDDFT